MSSLRRNGEHEASGNALRVRIDGQWQENFNNAKFIFDLKKDGDAFQVRSGGGGGGHPWERAIAAVRNDVWQGYVSVRAAAEIYGVVIEAETFVVDVEGAEKKRATLRRAIAASREAALEG